MYRPVLYLSADTEASEQSDVNCKLRTLHFADKYLFVGVSEVIKQRTTGLALKWRCFERGAVEWIH
jgi:hypothetical protein